MPRRGVISNLGRWVEGDALGRFKKNPAAFGAALDQIRADGSLPLETACGARALHCQRHAIAPLVAIVGLVATQGYDLYRLESENHGSLRRAIDFLLDAIRIQRWCCPRRGRNLNPGPFRNYLVRDFGFLVQRGHGRHYMASKEPYVARFPESATARRLTDLLVERGGERRLIESSAVAR
jgi:poly(beta-D-mannuronate) lyase